MTKCLCLLSPLLGVLAHLCLFSSYAPIFWVVGLIGAGVGVLGILDYRSTNKASRENVVSPGYFLLALFGVLAGLFYASMIGPFLVFFPKI